MLVAYDRTHHNTSADALTRHSVEQIEAWAEGMGFTRIEVHGRRNEFLARVKNNRLYRYIAPLRGPIRDEKPIPVAVWNTSGYTVCSIAQRFGFPPFQACGRHRFAERIEFTHGAPQWATSTEDPRVCGVGESELDLRDFTFYASNGGFGISGY